MHVRKMPIKAKKLDEAAMEINHDANSLLI